MADTVCDYLRERIKSFLAEKDESIRWLAKQCGVDYSVVYRLHEGERRGLEFRYAVKILKVVEPDRYKVTLAEYYPFETKELATMEQEQVDSVTLPLAIDRDLYRVHHFVTSIDANREQVKEKYGTDGLDRIEALIKGGVLSEIGGKFYDNLKGMVYPSEDILKRVSIHHFDMIPLAEAGSMLENFRGGVSREGLVDAYHASSEYRGKIHKILDEKKGDIGLAGSLIIGPTE